MNQKSLVNEKNIQYDEKNNTNNRGDAFRHDYYRTNGEI